jgi:COMPASS component BRE2
VHCSDTQQEVFERTTAGWKDICSTTIANLILEEILCRIGTESEELFERKHAALMNKWHPEHYYFNKKEIIPYVDKHWRSLCTERARTTTWWATLGSCLYSSKDTFIARDERLRSAASDFRLADPNLWHVRPVWGSVKTPRRRESDPDTGTPTTNTPSPRSSSPVPYTPSTVPAVFPPGTANTDHPFNRFGFKYIPCEPSILPRVAYQQAENSPGGCTISIPDKSSYVSVTKDGLTVTTDKGFRMCRANVGVKEGNWYWEATIQTATGDGVVKGPGNATVEGPHVRIGWARREGKMMEMLLNGMTHTYTHI